MKRHLKHSAGPAGALLRRLREPVERETRQRGTAWRRATIIVLLVPFLADLPAAQVLPPRDTGWAADTTAADQIEALLEPISEDDSESDSSAMLDMLEDLRARPIDINAATAEELALVPAISPRLAAAIVQMRADQGAFAAVADIRSVGGMTADAYRDALPYLTATGQLGATPLGPRRFPAVLRPSEVREEVRIELLQRVQRRLEMSRGYGAVPDSIRDTPDEPNHYTGRPERVYTRVRATVRRNLSANLTLEKDPGEPFMWDPASGFYGYDFVSFHAAALRMGRLEALVLGDFVAEFGQGVALWRASGFGKGRETVRPLVRRGRGLRPYGSTDEVNFLRGAGVSLAVTPQVYVSAFASRRLLDARLNVYDSTGTVRTVAGRPATGLHRTPAEIQRKRALGQTVTGAAAEARLRTATVGLVGYQITFDVPLEAGPQPHQRFDFEGDRATMASMYGSVLLGSYYLFGEIGRAPAGAVGGVAGVEGEIGSLNALLLVRRYPKDFVSLLGHGFGERNGATQNETGVYLGLRLQPARRWIVSAFVDQYRFPWVRFGVPRPSSGYEALFAIEHRPRSWLNHYVQARSETRETGLRITSPAGAAFDGLTTETRQTLRWQGEFVAGAGIRLRARLEGARYRQRGEPTETGVVLFHDVRWRASRALSLDGRLTYFDTDSFNARLYQFEGDLYGVLANTLLSGRGTRAYALVAIRPHGRWSGLDLRVKFARTHYRDRFTVGSGLDEIEGDRVRDVGVHARYRF